MEERAGNVTVLLRAWRGGDADALAQATQLIYDELHRMAAAYLRRERAGHTLQPTALVSEAYVRLCGDAAPPLESRGHFVAIGARTMRQILVDHARKRDAEKRGAGAIAVTLDESLVADARADTLLVVHEALSELETVDPRKAKIVELTYFGGLEQPEIAALLGVHVNTVARDLRLAKAFLKSHLV